MEKFHQLMQMFVANKVAQSNKQNAESAPVYTLSAEQLTHQDVSPREQEVPPFNPNDTQAASLRVRDVPDSPKAENIVTHGTEEKPLLNDSFGTPNKQPYAPHTQAKIEEDDRRSKRIRDLEQ